MNLHVILGPPGAGKAGRAVATLRAAADSGADAFLCVPGAVDRARFLRELAATDGGVLLGAEVGTFDQLVARVAGSPPVRRTDRAMERLVVRDALREVPAFRRAAAWSGFVDTARLHVDRLRRARVWGGAELARVEQDLPGVAIGYWQALEQRVAALLQERRLRDDAWFERRAAQALAAARPSVGAVVVYGFGHLPPARVELLERLARHVPVTVTLAWRPGRRVHERAADLRDRWRSRGAFIEELAEGDALHPVLGWLGSELFEDAPAAPPATAPDADAPAPLAFVECCGPLQETQEVVREVALLGGHGFAWDDIAVASARADDDGELLLAAFDRAGIPARLQSHRTAVDVPAGRAVHDLLDAVIARDALAVVAALRSPIFGVDRARVDAAELQLRRMRHRGAALLNDPALRRVLSDELEDIVALDQSRADGHVRAVRALLATLRPTDTGTLDLLRGIASTVEGLVIAAGGADGVRASDVRDAIAAFPLTTPDRSDAGTVVIASLDDLRSIAYDAVILRGMHLAGFRAQVDDEAEGPSAARDLLHLAVTRARRTLRVVRQRAGGDGGHFAPSPAWQELERLSAMLPAPPPRRARRLGDVVIGPADVRFDAEIAPALARSRAHGVDVQGAREEEWVAISAHARHARAATVAGPVAQELAATTQLAATSVERYAACSARWFIERWLGVSDPDDDVSRITDGQLAHELLRVLAPDVAAGKLQLQDASARALELAQELRRGVDPRGVLDEARIERIVRDVVTVLESEAEWERPDHVDVERSLGSDAEDAIANGLDIDGVEITGRVDRIDTYGSYAVLHDYKYSSTARAAKDLIEQHHLQLLVYWLALQQAGVPLEPIGAIYRSIPKAGATSGVYSEPLRELGVIGPRIRAGVLDQDQQATLLAQAREVVSDVVAGVHAGRVQPLTDPAQCPTHCRLQTICRVGEEAERA